MKKFLTLFLCALMALSLVACGGGSGSGEGDSMELNAIMDKLYEGISQDNMPSVETREIDAESFEGMFFIPAIEGAQAIASEPQMSSIAWSVCLLRLSEGSDVEAVRAEIEANVNPAKWCCVEATSVDVIAHGNTILLAMTGDGNENTHKAIVDNFNGLWK